MNNISIYILEDEIITQEVLKETLVDLDFKICGMASDAETALAEIGSLRPDIAILDIRVEGLQTGIWLGNQLDIPLIYLTALNDVDTIKAAIATKPASYLVKPFNTQDLFIAVELAVNKKNKAHIIVKDKNRKIIIPDDQILFAKKEDHYLVLHLKDSKKLIRSSIKKFLEQMNSSSFLQVHRSYVINKNCIDAFNTREIKINGNIIPISKTYAKKIIDEISLL